MAQAWSNRKSALRQETEKEIVYQEKHHCENEGEDGRLKVWVGMAL